MEGKNVAVSAFPGQKVFTGRRQRTSWPVATWWESDTEPGDFRVAAEAGFSHKRPEGADTYVGLSIFDRVLGQPIWISDKVESSPGVYTITWVDATGASV